MRRRSIRFRITALAVGAFVGVLVAVSIALIVVQRAQLTAAVDATLSQRAADIESVVANGQLPDLASTPEDTFTQIVGPNGEVIAASANLGRQALPEHLDQPIRDIELPAVDEDAFRLLSTYVETDTGRMLLHVGASFDDVTESVGILAASLGVAIPAVAFLLGWTVWWLVGRTLEPVERIRSEVATIGATGLERRVPQPQGSDEIARLAGTMNEMLDRLQRSVEQQQTFIADASHELRNPLTRMRTTLEVEIARLGPGEERDALTSSLEDVIALQALVEDLLHLARSDAGDLVVDWQTVDLDEVIRRAAAPLSGRPITIDIQEVQAIQVPGDGPMLARAVENLLSNACRHARDQVSVSLSQEGEQAVLAIEDDGPGIPAEKRDDVFERFARLDESRSRDHGGTGLGLAITRDIVERHDGTITLTAGVGGGARFEIRLRAGEAQTNL
jgi:signal transduction histidine kinase